MSQSANKHRLIRLSRKRKQPVRVHHGAALLCGHLPECSGKDAIAAK